MTAGSSDHPRLPVGIALAGAVLVGVLTAVQGRLNGELGHRIDDGFVAAFISFGSGFAILAIVAAVLPAGRRGVAGLVDGVRRRRVPWWMLAGGAAGAFTVATQGISVAVIGMSLFTVGVVAGQTVAGLVLDRIGFGPAGVVAVTVPRLVGGALALVAVVLSLQGDAIAGIPLWMLVLPFLAGIGISWQQGTNGRLRARVGSPMIATLVNFTGGSLVLAVVAGIHLAVVGVPEPFPTDPLLYLGGAAGVVYILLSAALVVHTGVALLGLGSVAGQLVTAFALDLFWPARSGPGILQSLLMVLVALTAVVVAAAPGLGLLRRRA